MPLALAAALLVASLVARRGFPLPPADRRLGCVDGLRGYLALAVLAHHLIVWHQLVFAGTGWRAPTVNAFSQFGIGAVALFFMVTGFVFYPRVVTGWRANDWRAILIGRVFRIVPLIAVTVAVVLLLLVLRTGRLPGPRDLAAAAVWVSGWGQPALLGDADAKYLNAGVLWSLWYEWVFYLLILPLAAIARDLVRGRLPGWSVPLAFLALGFAARAVPLPRDLGTYLPLFAIGMLAFEVQAIPAIRRHLAGPLAAAMAVAALAVAAVTAPDPLHGPQLALFALFFVTIACGNPLFGLLSRPGSLVLGECSYGIYLVHGIVLAVLFTEGRPLVLALGEDGALALVIPAAMLVALITAGTFLAVERPMIAVGRRLARSVGGRKLALRPAELQVAP